MATLNDVPQAAPPAHSGTFLGHPTGLFLLFLVEMWERFSYYGMRGLLVLYLTSSVAGMAEPYAGAPAGFNPGPGWSPADASNLYGWYTSLAYLFPLAGGIIADKLIGTHRSMLIGGVLISLGHVVLAVSGLVPVASPLSMTIFVGGLALIVLGTGHFKPNVSVMVGQLYAPDDPRREGAFSIFYMGINLGAFICAYICGTLGERVGWHWGFGSAAVGMVLGLGLYTYLRPKFMPGIGLPPGDRGSLSSAFLVLGVGLALVAAILFHVGAFGALDALLSSRWVAIPLAIAAAIAAIAFTFSQPLGDRGPVASIFLFMLFNVVFWLSFEQAGSSINIFTNEHTNRTIGSFEVFTTWFQSINPLLIIIAAPIFGAIWVSLARRDVYISQPAKIGTGLMLVGLGYGFMVLAALQAQNGAKAAMWLVVATYSVHTIGEIILSPTGLAYVTRAAPQKHVSLLMGTWFLSSFLANLLAGKVAAQVGKVESGEIDLPWNFGGQADFFFLFIVTSCTAGLVVLVTTPLLKKLMRNPKD